MGYMKSTITLYRGPERRYPASHSPVQRRRDERSPRTNGMAPFGKRFTSGHAIIAACYQDEFAINFKLSNWCRYKPILLRSCRRRAQHHLRWRHQSTQRFIEKKGGRRDRWGIRSAKVKGCSYSYHQNVNISVNTTTPPRPRT